MASVMSFLGARDRRFFLLYASSGSSFLLVFETALYETMAIFS